MTDADSALGKGSIPITHTFTHFARSEGWRTKDEELGRVVMLNGNLLPFAFYLLSKNASSTDDDCT